MIVTVNTLEEANEKAKEGYKLVAVNKMSEYEYVSNDHGHQPMPCHDYLSYTLQCPFLTGMANHDKGL